MMTFEQFQATRRQCPDLGNELHDARWDEEAKPQSGLVYVNGCYIETRSDNWSDKAQEYSYYLILERDDYLSDDLEELERKLYIWAMSSGAIDNMQVHYSSAGEQSSVMPLSELLRNFEDNSVDSGVRYWINDITNQLDGLGWYEGTHDFGKYLILNLTKMHLEHRDTAMDV